MARTEEGDGVAVFNLGCVSGGLGEGGVAYYYGLPLGSDLGWRFGACVL